MGKVRQREVTCKGTLEGEWVFSFIVMAVVHLGNALLGWTHLQHDINKASQQLYCEDNMKKLCTRIAYISISLT